MKKFKSFVLAMIGLLCSSSVSAEDFEVDGIYYNITSSTNKTVEVTFRGNYDHSYSNEYSGAVNIPESVTYNGKTYNVTSIGEDAFSICSGLSSVEIPNSVTSIGDHAFGSCKGLTSVEIPNSVTSIGDYAFGSCSSLTSVQIPNSVSYIGTSIFSGTAWYNNQPDGLVYCEDFLLGYKGTMAENTSISIKDGTKLIAGSVFYGCSGLTSIKIPNSVTSIGKSVFHGCSSLTSVQIPNSVTSIGESAFWGCSGLTSVEIPNSVTSIGSFAFSDCSSLTSVVIGNGVTSIGSSAFSGCTNLLSITLGNSIKRIYDSWSDLQLRTIICLNPNAVEIIQGAFSMNTFNHAVVYVPEDSYWNYAYSNWGAFIHIKEIVTEANSLQSRKAYMIADSKGTNFKVYDAERDALKNMEYTHALDEESEDCCWTVMKENGETYLYNLGAKKFGAVGDNGAITLSETPVHVTISETEVGLSINGNNCMFVLNKHVEVDATGISDVLLNGQDAKNAQIHSLDGRRQQTLKRGVNIVNGKKVFVQ